MLERLTDDHVTQLLCCRRKLMMPMMIMMQWMLMPYLIYQVWVNFYFICISCRYKLISVSYAYRVLHVYLLFVVVANINLNCATVWSIMLYISCFSKFKSMKLSRWIWIWLRNLVFNCRKWWRWWWRGGEWCVSNSWCSFWFCWQSVSKCCSKRWANCLFLLRSH